MRELIRVGLWELAIGALFGWVVVTSIAAPSLLTRIGIAHPRRILQAHLEYMVSGVILVVIGLVVANLPTWVAVMLAISVIVNPTMFLLLAFRQSLLNNIAFRAVNTASLLATSVGLIMAAVFY